MGTKPWSRRQFIQKMRREQVGLLPILVKTLQEQVCEFQLPLHSTVEELKDLLCEQLGFHPSAQHIVWRRQVLKNTTELGECDREHKDSLTLLLLIIQRESNVA